MTTNNVLQPIAVNSRGMDGSPACKRTRFSNSAMVKERWSLTCNDVLLDDVFDYGVALLESEPDLPTDEDRDRGSDAVQQTYGGSETDIVPLPDTDCDSHRKLSIREWGEFLVTKPIMQETDTPESELPKYFSYLSDEILLHIFHFLPKSHLTTASLVCHHWHRLARDESLWARMDVSCRNLPPGSLGHILSRQVLILRLAQSKISHPAILPNCRAHRATFHSRLMYLDLSMAHVSAVSLVGVFSRCRKLKKVSLEHVGVDDEVLLALSRSGELEVLNLAMAMGVQVGGCRYLLEGCKKLRELNIAWTYLNSACLSYLCAHLPSTLDRLNISGCRKLLTDKNTEDLVSRCPTLRELDLSDCTALTDTTITHITHSLHSLNFLAASRCYLITYRALLLLRQLPTLVYLDVHGGYIGRAELQCIQDGLGAHVNVNKFKFSSVARPTVGGRRSSIWNLKVRD